MKNILVEFFIIFMDFPLGSLKWAVQLHPDILSDSLLLVVVL
jgi:hypothetical protein